MKYLVLSLLLVISFCSCEKSDSDAVSTQLDVSASCTITSPAEKIVVANSEEELTQLLEDRSQFPKVDFSRYTVLLTHGIENSGISHLSSKVSEQNNTWMMSVTIEHNYATVMEPWIVAYLIPKTNGVSAKLEIFRD